jgi:signal transduction histidine kinase
VRLLNRLRIKQKLALVLGIAALSLLAAVVTGAIALHQKMYSDREHETRQMVEVAVSAVKYWYAKELSGDLTESEAQASALAALRALRYGNNGYFAVNTYDGVTRLHPNRPDLEGKQRLEVTDSDGVPHVRLQIERARSGGGFVQFRFPRLGSDVPVPKLYYSAGFDPWRWAIGTGAYIDDIESEFHASLVSLVMIAAAIFALAAASAVRVSQNIGTSLTRLKVKMEKLATGDLTVAIDEAGRGDEIGDMGRAMGVFKANAVAARELAEERERRRELETMVSHAGKIEAIGRLAGGIAHDLNNALVPVLAMTKRAMARVPKESRVYANLDLAMTGALRAKDLVQQILSFSRKEEIAMRDFKPGPVIADGVRLLRASLPGPIRIVSKIDDVPAINGDPGQLNQILVNLVANSAHAVGDRPGLITVALLSPEPGVVKLTVADTGCGMDEATKARMFEPFFTTKPEGQGTGLGMSVVRGIVHAHRGTIAVESRRGEGTRIEVTVPAAAVAASVAIVA